MDPPAASPATRYLQRLSDGDSGAADGLLLLLYGELHELAEQSMRRERGDHTLQPTALVHEAWLRIAGDREPRWESRSHFLCLAAKAMRSVLVDHARRRKTQKRGSGAARVPLGDVLASVEGTALDVLVLNEALDKLALRDAELARLVELRFFAGLTVEETARVLGLTVRQVEGAWVTARGWLAREMRDRDGR